MKKIIILLLTSVSLASNLTPIKITSIIDGDTINAKIDNNNFAIRLIGIDCFEKSTFSYRIYKQAYDNNLTIDEVIKKGRYAKQYLNKLYKNYNTPF